MRENDNHPLTTGTYGDWREQERPSLELLTEMQDTLALVIDGGEHAPWLTREEAVVQAIHQIRVFWNV